LLQQIINKLYRYPKAKLARINKFGGYIEYQKMMRGQKAMELASFDLPPVESYPNGLPIYFLTGEKFLYQTLFCIHSLSKHSSEKFKFILIDDGSFSASLIKRINKQLPHSGIITEEVIEKNLEKNLPETKYFTLRKKRREYPHIKKLIDIHTLDNRGWKLVLDSDMLFFEYPTAMVQWLKKTSQPLHMIDCTESYGYSRPLMEQLCRSAIPQKINVGAIGLNSEAIDWTDVESWVKTLEDTEGRSYYLEQALSAMLLAGKNCTVLKENKYIVNPDDKAILSGAGILHHYVDLSKKGYYTEAWRKVI
jgi:hypothetical protein